MWIVGIYTSDVYAGIHMERMFEGKHNRYNMVIFMHNFLIFALVSGMFSKIVLENPIIVHPHPGYKIALPFDIDITSYL